MERNDTRWKCCGAKVHKDDGWYTKNETWYNLISLCVRNPHTVNIPPAENHLNQFYSLHLLQFKISKWVKKMKEKDYRLFTSTRARIPVCECITYILFALTFLRWKVKWIKRSTGWGIYVQRLEDTIFYGVNCVKIISFSLFYKIESSIIEETFLSKSALGRR